MSGERNAAEAELKAFHESARRFRAAALEAREAAQRFELLVAGDLAAIAAILGRVGAEGMKRDEGAER